MIEPEVKVSTEADSVTIAVAGAIDLATAPGVQDRILAAIGNDTTVVTLDLTTVDYIDSAGLRIVFHLVTRLEEQRTQLTVVAPPGSVGRRVLELSGFPELGTLLP